MPEYNDHQKSEQNTTFPTEGLSTEDLNLLDATINIKTKNELLSRLRKKYADNPLALEILDGYDKNSLHFKKVLEYKDALLSQNQEKQQELEAWFEQHYPLTSKRNRS